jgi:glycosyltransferase involved in cell wall biosynthesis
MSLTGTAFRRSRGTLTKGTDAGRGRQAFPALSASFVGLSPDRRRYTDAPVDRVVARRQLLFVSPRFLFPADSGGKIRTAQILRGLKGREFTTTLLSPGCEADAAAFRSALDEVCDRFVAWPERGRGRLFGLARLRHLLSPLPIPVATDRSTAGRRAVEAELARGPAVVVFDFAHAAVLAPPRLAVPSVLFTHNVESRIFQRHAQLARNPLLRLGWRSQWRKMERFEKHVVERFDTVVAVSEEDAGWFREHCRGRSVRLIPTGVDLERFDYAPPASAPQVVFTGSMDWLANQDGMQFLMDEIWPHIARAVPEARMRVVGRQPPAALLRRAARLPWEFTGFVDDVRSHVRDGSVFVIPLRVGGGTRIKAFEAMALGLPVVATSVGVEGLELEPGTHYLRADTAREFADAVIRLLRDPECRERLSRTARRHVEQKFSARRAAEAFEQICLDAIASGRP